MWRHEKLSEAEKEWLDSLDKTSWPKFNQNWDNPVEPEASCWDRSSVKPPSVQSLGDAWEAVIEALPNKVTQEWCLAQSENEVARGMIRVATHKSLSEVGRNSR